MNNSLSEILDNARAYEESGDRKALSLLLREIIPVRVECFYHSRQLNRLSEYIDLLYKILCLELEKEENESIEMAELAYLGICEEIKSSTDKLYDNLRKRIILIHYFTDYFTDSLIELFFDKYRKKHLLEARNLILESLARMQLADMAILEEQFSSRAENDEVLDDVGSNIQLAIYPNQSEIAEAKLMHKVFYAYLKVKYKPAE